MIGTKSDACEAGLLAPLLEQPSTSSGSGAREARSRRESAEQELPEHLVANTLSQTDQHGIGWQQTTAALLTLQLGWGLWLLPSDFARLGWVPSIALLVTLSLSTAYSGLLFTRLFVNTPGAVLLGDIGHAAVGRKGRNLVYAIVWALDAMRCVILVLATTQSIRHVFPKDSMPPLWQCGAAASVWLAVLVQIRSLAELSWVFLTGTAAQLVAIGMVAYVLVAEPDPAARRAPSAITADAAAPCLVALMNMVFAFGGQFAFVELMGSMRRPREFPRAVSICTVTMALLYGAVGAVGYWSRGDAIQGIVIFSLGDGKLLRAASAAIFVQATAQALCQLNVWTHNVLVITSRLGRGSRGDGKGQAAPEPTCSHHHCRWQWLLASVIIVAYSYVLAISLPFFSTLVGLVTAATYLVCAYALPAWFTLRHVGIAGRLRAAERALLWAIIPAALALSAAGLWASIQALINDMGSGEGWGSPPGSKGLRQAASALFFS